MKTKNFDAYQLKLFAIIGMLLDHIAVVFPDIPLFLKYPFYFLGGITFPIMAYLLIEGHKYTKNKISYGIRLFIFALISQIPYTLAFINNVSLQATNIFFTLFLCYLLIIVYKRFNKFLFILFYLFVLALQLKFAMDWAIAGPILMVMLLMTGESQERLIYTLPIFSITIIVSSGFMYDMSIFNIIFFVGSGTLALFLLYNYNGERGKPMKYLFYIFYPLHLLILYLVNIYIF